MAINITFNYINKLTKVILQYHPSSESLIYHLRWRLLVVLKREEEESIKFQLKTVNYSG